MDIQVHSNSSDNNNNIEQNNKTDRDKVGIEENENHEKYLNDFYTHTNGNFGFFPEDTSNESLKKQKRTSKAESDHSILMNSLETILKKVDQLQKDVNQLMERGKKINGNGKNNEEILRTLISNLPNINSIEKNKDKMLQDDNVDMSKADICEEFFSIYHSSTVKKSLSLNKELEDKIKKLVAQHYGITDNDSKIINTALMIALLKMH